jgi:Set1/Ash2 histone methyltransferase complex subunit ASH2
LQYTLILKTFQIQSSIAQVAQIFSSSYQTMSGPTVAAPTEPEFSGWQPPPPDRSKKRKHNDTSIKPTKQQHQDTVRLGQTAEGLKDQIKARLNPITLSQDEKANGMFLDEQTQLTVTSSLGYRSIRATTGVCEGTWYFEVKINSLGPTGAARIGWSVSKAELQAPVGADIHGYGYRSLEGSAVHAGVRRPFGTTSKDFAAEYGEGDVIGCIIHLPPGGRLDPLEKDLNTVFKYRGKLYYPASSGGRLGGRGGARDDDDDDMTASSLPGSFIAFTKNGKFQGVAYTDIYEGTYYPTISLYTKPTQAHPASVTANFGTPAGSGGSGSTFATMKGRNARPSKPVPEEGGNIKEEEEEANGTTTTTTSAADIVTTTFVYGPPPADVLPNKVECHAIALVPPRFSTTTT